jgi:hypothetical protein
MLPSFTYGRGDDIHRYYVSFALQWGGQQPAKDGCARRVPSVAGEELVRRHLKIIPCSANIDRMDVFSSSERWCEFSQRLLAQRPISCFSALPTSLIAAVYMPDRLTPAVTSRCI